MHDTRSFFDILEADLLAGANDTPVREIRAIRSFCGSIDGHAPKIRRPSLTRFTAGNLDATFIAQHERTFDGVIAGHDKPKRFSRSGRLGRNEDPRAFGFRALVG